MNKRIIRYGIGCAFPRHLSPWLTGSCGPHISLNADAAFWALSSRAMQGPVHISSTIPAKKKNVPCGSNDLDGMTLTCIEAQWVYLTLTFVLLQNSLINLEELLGVGSLHVKHLQGGDLKASRLYLADYFTSAAWKEQDGVTTMRRHKITIIKTRQDDWFRRLGKEAVILETRVIRTKAGWPFHLGKPQHEEYSCSTSSQTQWHFP